MPSKGRIDFKEKVLNKTLLALLTLFFGILSVIGLSINLLLGAVFMMFFVATFSVWVRLDKIKELLEKLNDEL